jgi:uncharacterized protein
MQLLVIILLALAGTTTIRLPSGKTLKVEVASTGEEIAKGLIGRASLPPDSGMLFVYPGDIQSEYNLMGYRFPVDILYLDEMKIVINLKENAVPCRTANCGYPSIWPYRYALQVPAGTAKRLNLHAGDTLSFDLPVSATSRTR